MGFEKNPLDRSFQETRPFPALYVAGATYESDRAPISDEWNQGFFQSLKEHRTTQSKFQFSSYH
jgi:hypothetical protein